MSTKKTVIFLVLTIITVVFVVFKKKESPPNTTTMQEANTLTNEVIIATSPATELTYPFQKEVSANSQKKIDVDLDEASGQTKATKKNEEKDLSPTQATEMKEKYSHDNKTSAAEKLIDIRGVFHISFFPKEDSPLDIFIKNSTAGFFYFSEGQVIEKPDEKSTLERFCAIELWKNPDYSSLNSDGLLSTWISKQSVSTGPVLNRTNLIFLADQKSFKKRILKILKIVAIGSTHNEFATDFTLSELERCFNSSIVIDYPKISTQ